MRYAGLLLIGVVVFGQNGSPTFEVASVKPSLSNSRPYGGGGPGTADPEHARYLGTPLKRILLMAPYDQGLSAFRSKLAGWREVRH